MAKRDTVIRAGYARAFDPGYGGTIFGIAATQSPPVGVIETIRSFSGLSALLVNSALGLCQPCTVPPFVIPSAPFTVRDLSNLNDLNTGIVVGEANLYALPRRLRLPTVDAWNLAVQHALNRNTYLEIAYVGNKGTHVLNDSLSQVPYYDLNQPTLVGFIAPCSTLFPSGPFCKTTSLSRQAFNPWHSEVRYFGSAASSNYNSLQVKVRRQFSSGFSMLAAYTWAKVLDYDNTYYAIDPRVSHGIGNFDRAHNFVMTNTWALPIGRGHAVWGNAGPVLDKLVGGWSLAAVTLWSSGFPFTPTYLECGADIDPSPYQPCRPNRVGALHITGSRSQYFTTTGGQALQAACGFPNSLPPGSPCFAPDGLGYDFFTGKPLVGQTIGPWQRPGAGQIGNAGRNPLRGPGFFQADLSIAKEVAVTERLSVRFRADAFNVFNKVNLANPQTAVDSPVGGQIISLAPNAIQRQIQFSLHVVF